MALINLFLVFAALWTFAKPKSAATVGRWGRVGAQPEVAKHWYKAISQGAFLDLLDLMRNRGFTIVPSVNNERIATAKLFDTTFALIHDIDDPVCLQILDKSQADWHGVWAKTDPIMRDILSSFETVDMPTTPPG